MLEVFIKITIIATIAIMLISFIGWAFWKIIIAMCIAAVVVVVLVLRNKFNR